MCGAGGGGGGGNFLYICHSTDGPLSAASYMIGPPFFFQQKVYA